MTMLTSDPTGNELTGFSQNGTLNGNGTVSAAYNVSITYDANGNRIDASDGNNAHYTAVPNNQYSSDWTGALTYDDNANLKTRAGWTFTYDAQNRLTSIDSGSTHIHQHYDPLNRIVAWNNGPVNGPAGTTQVWDGWNLIEEHTANDSFQRMYFYGAAVNEIVCSTGPGYGDAFYFQDGRGNVTHLTGPANNVIEHYTYFVSGQPNYLGGSAMNNRFLFEGATFIPEAGIYDMRNRFYLPNLGRFMQSDPIGFDAGDMNLFRYCGDDPVDRSDPMGLDWAAIDSEAESWSLKASEQNVVARQREGRFQYIINRFQHSEFATTVYRENGKTGMSKPYTDGNPITVNGRNYPGKTSLVYSHTHNHDRNSWVTKSHLSVPDIRAANNSGVPVQVTTPSGEVDRVRPSTAGTRDGRWNEVATIERFNSEKQKFETLKGANANVPRYGLVDEGMAGQDQPAPSAKDVDAAHPASGVPSLGAEAVNFVRASRL